MRVRSGIGLGLAAVIVGACSASDAPDAGPSRDTGVDTFTDVSADTGVPGTDDVVDDASTSPPDAATCAALTTCGACSTVAGCGWCGTSGRCLAGDGNGSSDGTCTGAAWDFTGDNCGAVTDAGPQDSGSSFDAGCVPTVPRGGENNNALCSDGVDNDCNGYVDCADFGCSRNTSVSVCRDAGAADTGVHDAGAHDAGAPFDAGPAGPIGPTGGTVGLLHFGVFGDVRPPNNDDTSGYPSTVIRSVMQNLHTLGTQFAVASGDYMFATSSSAVSAQLDLFLGAESAFGGHVFHAMGNHECTGATASNCPRATETPNVQAYMARLATGYRAPYFDWMIHTSLGDAHFIAAAPNAWSTTQQTWLRTALAQSARYTFVLAHEPPTGTQGPGSAAIDSLLATRTGGVTLRLYGHTHEFRHISANAVVDGNAGAPLAGTGSSGDYYGFAVVDQRSDGNVVFTAYQVGNPPTPVESFVVTPAGAATH